jgi:hypothetical protein
MTDVAAAITVLGVYGLVGLGYYIGVDSLVDTTKDRVFTAVCALLWPAMLLLKAGVAIADW